MCKPGELVPPHQMPSMPNQKLYAERTGPSLSDRGPNLEIPERSHHDLQLLLFESVNSTPAAKRAHLEHRREPAKGGRFAWGRALSAIGDTATWRLFRRAIAGRLYLEQATFPAGAARADIAHELRAMRARLRDTVDAIDLAYLGLTP